MSPARVISRSHSGGSRLLGHWLPAKSMFHYTSCDYTSWGLPAVSVCRQYLHQHGSPPEAAHRCNSVPASPSKGIRLLTIDEVTGFGADSRMCSTCLCTTIHPPPPGLDAAFLAGSRSNKQASIVMLVSTHVAVPKLIFSQCQFVAYPFVRYQILLWLRLYSQHANMAQCHVWMCL